MTQEQKQKIDGLREKIAQLNTEINKCHNEINGILMEAEANFVGSNVVYYNGDEFVFMKVEKQFMESEANDVNLQGPSLRMTANPLLDDEDEYDGVDEGTYSEWDGIHVSAETMQGVTYHMFTRIPPEDMERVVDFYLMNVRKNLLR